MMVRAKTETFIRLERRVTRTPTACAFCNYPRVELDAQFVPQVDRLDLKRLDDDGVMAVRVFCSPKCAAIAVPLPMVVVYA